MAPVEGVLAERLTLVDTLDHLLHRGVVVVGETTIALGEVDLIYVGLNLLVASVESLRRHPREPTSGAPLGAPRYPSSDFSSPAAVLPAGGEVGRTMHAPAPAMAPRPGPPPDPAHVPAGLPARLATDGGERPEQGLARLVLALVELLRQLLERQALRRLEGASLTEDQIERMGQALMELEAKMAELRAAFGLTEDDLTIDLGPLGELR